MKKLQPNQLGPWCSFCGNKETRATYRENGWHGKFCCDNHIQELTAYEVECDQRELYTTEADRQTWMRVC